MEIPVSVMKAVMSLTLVTVDVPSRSPLFPEAMGVR
jgi:hypothetical protein